MRVLVISWLSVISAGLPLFTYLLTRWSRRQDRAIKAAQEKQAAMVRDFDRVIKTSNVLKAYIRRLHDLMRRHNIDYPSPPDEFWTDDTFESRRIP